MWTAMEVRASVLLAFSRSWPRLLADHTIPAGHHSSPAPAADLDLVAGNYRANELLMYTRCPEVGVQLHSSSSCFACPSFMGRAAANICLECVPDYYS